MVFHQKEYISVHWRMIHPKWFMSTWDSTTVHKVVYDTYSMIINIPTGGIALSGGMNFSINSGLNGPNPQFTLTCISTGGPATAVTWTRDSIAVTEGTETVLNNATTAQYTHTLTVSGRVGGLYTCTVTNKVSNHSSQLNITGK